jgi:hypothetical protein
MAVNLTHPSGWLGPEYVAAAAMLRAAVDKCRKVSAQGTNLVDAGSYTALASACGGITTGEAQLMLGRVSGFLAMFDNVTTPDGKNFIDNVA